MNEYIIATSSTSDLPRTWLDAHGIPFIPYSYTVNDEPREDDCREETRQAVYEGMRRGDKLKTSMINEFIYYDFFKSLLDTGRDVLFLDMSREMSVSFVNANQAAEMIRPEYPQQRLYVMDTLCISGGLGLLVTKLVELKESGADFDAVIAWGEEHKLKIAHRFTVDDLNYLKTGGRVSNASALIGTVLIRGVQETITSLGPDLVERIPSLSSDLIFASMNVFLGLIITLFLLLEPKGLMHRWNILKANYRLWPFHH